MNVKFSIRKLRGKGQIKDQGKNFQTKEENKNISYNFYQ